MYLLQAEIAVKAAETVIEADIPLWEKIVLVALALGIVAVFVFIWKALPKIIERQQKKKDIDLDAKIEAADKKAIGAEERAKHAEDLEAESRQMFLETKLQIDKIFEMLDRDKCERAAKYAEFEGKIGEILKEIDELKSETESMYRVIAAHEDLFEKVSQGTLETMLFSDEYPNMFNRLTAFYRLTALGVNSRVLEKGKKLILENKEAWLNLLSLNLDVEFSDAEYFNRAMEDIDKRIFSGMMGNWKRKAE